MIKKPRIMVCVASLARLCQDYALAMSVAVGPLRCIILAAILIKARVSALGPRSERKVSFIGTCVIAVI